ncbi:hypothetical protein QBZ16_004697 [Prototheca wickerhamii]|uniref:Nucleotide-diphospho-sugar transferase domain-containing protein n=1 Tax=Prototheca wickerhamii TaxID=3111 RepID=A0AAD9IH64_PROWI|nr:hypothetical protein QBZ16_004697 [Prototheca wickerhamii]
MTNFLTRELLESVADNGTVIVTVGNTGRRNFLENLIQSLRRAGCSSLVVGSVDANLTAWLTEREVPTFAIDLGRDAQDADTSGNLEWRGRTYLKLMKAKVSTILTGIRLGYSVLWTDSDVVWLRNPIPLLARYPDHDVLASSDHMYSAERTEKLEHHNNYYYQPNTGIALYRPSAEHVVLGWLYCLSEGKDSDQPCLGRLLQRDLKPIESPEANAALYVAVQVLWAYYGSTIFGTLPINYFVGGQMWRCPEAKINRLRDDSLWLLDGADRYEHPVGFISYEPEIADSLLQAAAAHVNLTEDEARQQRQKQYGDAWDRAFLPDKIPHLNLVNNQLSQLRTQIVLARELGGAAAILPYFMCGSTKDSFRWDGRVEWSASAIPFRCPADYILDFRAIQKENPNGFRETSFLQRDEARTLNQTRLDITICKKGDTDCVDGEVPVDIPSGRATLRLLPGRTLKQLRTVLGPAIKEHKLLHFQGNMTELLVMSPPEVADQSKATQQYMMASCCMHDDPAGSIRYDLFWDLPGHYSARGEFIKGNKAY